MGARGRKSAASLVAVTPIGERLLMCRPEAAEEVRAVFARLVADVGADYFRASDADLIEQYAAAICLAREAYDQLRDGGPVKDGRVNPWQTVLEKANRASVSLSQRLRLAPQSRLDPKTAGRSKAGGSVYDFE